MQLGFNPVNHKSNISFKAFDEMSQNKLLSDIRNFDDYSKDKFKKLIKEENKRKDRSIKLSDVKVNRRTSQEYRNVLVWHNLTNDYYKTTVRCGDFNAFSKLLRKIDIIM